MKLELPFHRQIFSELVAEDGLLIMGKGFLSFFSLDSAGLRHPVHFFFFMVIVLLLSALAGMGLPDILGSLVALHCDSKLPVFLLNLDKEDQVLLFEDLALEGETNMPNVVDAEVPATERVDLYQRGGVVAVSNRILVVDLLSKRVKPEDIGGFIVNQAHKVTETGTEAFILRLFRERNKKGFIKALSESPTSFTGGFSKVEKSMRYLFLKTLYLWPRFHMAVADSFERQATDVVECSVPMTESMTKIQASILDVLELSLKELKKSNPSLEVPDATSENALFSSFDTLVRMRLDPSWHTVSAKTKQLVQDLQILRKLLNYLGTYDCVSFNHFLETLLASFHTFGTQGQQSSWLLLDATNVIFSLASARVYTLKPLEDAKEGDRPAKRRKITSMDDIVPTLEENPKWELLEDVLHDIQEAERAATEKRKGKEKETPPPAPSKAEEGGNYTVLVLTSSERTCTQLEDYLALGGKGLLTKHLSRHFEWKAALPKLGENMSIKQQQQTGSTEGESSTASVSGTTHTTPLPSAAPVYGQYRNYGQRKRAALSKHKSEHANMISPLADL